MVIPARRKLAGKCSEEYTIEFKGQSLKFKGQEAEYESGGSASKRSEGGCGRKNGWRNRDRAPGFPGRRANDSEKDGEYLAGKIIHLRIFSDEQGLMNRSVLEMGGGILVVSQFTLWGDCIKGRRPSFTRAAPPEKARMLYEHFTGLIREKGLKVATGVFQEMMEVHLLNDGPVTMLLDTEKTF